MKINYFVFVLFWLNIFSVHAQLTFHQDIFYGGVTMGGFSTDHQSYGSTGENPLQLYIEPGSTIRHAYLFHYQVGPSITSTVTLNDTEFVFTGEDEILNVERINPIGTPVRYLYKDITDYLNDNLTDVFNIEVECEAFNNFGGFSAYVYIEYDNPNLSKVCSNFVINNQFIDNNITLDISMSNVNNLNPVGLACYFDNITSSEVDEEVILIDNEYAGTLSGSDNINSDLWGGGVKGHFYYQNNELYGLDDDNEDEFLGGSDGVTNLQNIIAENSFVLSLIDDNLISNYPLFFVNSYTTPCDTFSTSIIANQTICQGDSIILIASGGITSYLWNNTTFLNDSTSSSVIAFPDTTTTYIVKIENQPGCYRTEQVTVRVNPTPVINSIETIPNTCGESGNGIIQVDVEELEDNTYQYSLGENFTNENIFENVSEGSHTITVQNNYGCTVDTLLVLPSEIEVNAQFEASPWQGDEPLEVQINNQSSQATNYNWYINDSLFSYDENPNLFIDTNGIYSISLIAYNNLITCSDTLELNIIVNNAFSIKIPNIFTPNNDGFNDAFSIQTDDVTEIWLQVYNRWGNLIFETKRKIEPTIQTTPLWEGKNKEGKKIASGTYYYIIEVARPNGERHNYQGNVMVME